jgi:hypothetical protein
MRKQDLKEGVEYAIYLNPSAARSRWSHSPPRKATLVEIGGSVEERVKIVGYHGSYREMTDFRKPETSNEPYEKALKETGIVVDLAEPISGRKLSPSGLYVETRYGGLAPVEEYEQEDFEAEVQQRTRIALKNGACFISTWAEHEQAEKDAAEAKRKRVAEEKREHEIALAGVAAVEAKLDTVLNIFRAAGYTVEEDYSYGSSYEANPAEVYCVDEYHLTRPGVERSRFGHHVEIDLQYRSNHGLVRKTEAERYPLIGFTISKLSADDLLRLVGTPFDQ